MLTSNISNIEGGLMENIWRLTIKELGVVEETRRILRAGGRGLRERSWAASQGSDIISSPSILLVHLKEKNNQHSAP